EISELRLRGGTWRRAEREMFVGRVLAVRVDLVRERPVELGRLRSARLSFRQQHSEMLRVAHSASHVRNRRPRSREAEKDGLDDRCVIEGRVREAAFADKR